MDSEQCHHEKNSLAIDEPERQLATVDFVKEADSIYFDETPTGDDDGKKDFGAELATPTSNNRVSRDLKLLERYGGRIDTALGAREILMRRRRSKRFPKASPGTAEAYNDMAMGVLVNEHKELYELIDEIEMLESMIIEMQTHQEGRETTWKAVDERSHKDRPLIGIMSKTMKQNPHNLIQRLSRRLNTMKAAAVNKAMSLNLIQPDDDQEEAGFPDRIECAEQKGSPRRRVQTGKEFIQTTYPDIIHKPKTKLFENSPSQIGKKSSSPYNSPDILPLSPPESLDLEVDRRLRSSLRYAQRRQDQRESVSSIPPRSTVRRRWPQKNSATSPTTLLTSDASEGRNVGLKRSTSARVRSDSSLAESRRHCDAFFEWRLTSTKDANSWLVRDRHSDEMNWILGLRQYEPLDV